MSVNQTDRAGTMLVRPLTAWIFLAAMCAVSFVNAAGILDDWGYPIVLVGNCVAISIGIRRNRPTHRWHWWAFILASLLWTTAGIVRADAGATGDLTESRSLLPDVFAIPPYLIVAIALSGLLRSRFAGSRDPNAWLDGAVVSLAALLIAWTFAVGPSLADTGAWLPAQIAVAIYPPLSALLVMISCRLAFGSAKRSGSHQMVFAGSVCLLLGDIAFAMAEVGTLTIAHLYELPFMIASALFGAAALHPSMRHLSRPDPTTVHRLTWGRITMLGGALVLPALVVVALPPVTTAAKWFFSVNLCALALAAAARLLFSVRDHARSETRLSHQATHDDLTKLANRVLALDHIEMALRDRQETAGTLAVLYADLDQFKLINDSMGHGVGDELLVAAAARIESVIGGDHLIARMSGDEFLVVCDHVDVTAARAIAERIRTCFDAAFDLSTGTMHTTTSIGIAIAAGDLPTDAMSLVRDADTAMYASKTAGRNTITVFNLDMRQRVERRVELERSMRASLAAGDIVAHYQPLVTLPSGQVEGFEALARWIRPRDVVHPAEFIAVAEESGLIVPLGSHILAEACRQIAEWRRTLLGAADAYVAVNLSPRQIRETDIVATVARELDRSSLPGSALRLEITEGLLMEDSVDIQNRLRALRTLGVSVSIDDFGTGYSSLAYLKRFPISTVKIDKSFVDGLDDIDADNSLVAAIIAMATALNLTTLAEGVERATQACRLFELGCRHAQGYYFARPVPATDVPAVTASLGFAQPLRPRSTV